MSQQPADSGWYPDPDDPGGERYWNGSEWTAWSGSQGQVYPAKPPSSLVMWGVLSCLLFSPVGIVIGIILLARHRTRAGLAIVALNVVSLPAAVILLA